MAQAVSLRPLIVETRARARVSPCGICCEQSGAGIGFLRTLLFSPVNIIPPWLSILIIWRMNNRLVSGCTLQRQSHPIDMNHQRSFKMYQITNEI